MDETAAKKITEGLKRVGDDERALVLAWLLTYFEDDGRMRSPRTQRRSITLDSVPFFLVRIVRKH